MRSQKDPMIQQDPTACPCLIHQSCDGDDSSSVSSLAMDEESDSGAESGSGSEMLLDGPDYPGQGSQGERQLVA